MDDRYIKNQIRRRERGYIWLERELKKNMLISTAVIAIFFIMILNLTKFSILQRAFVLLTALVLNVVWCYLLYQREYRNYQSIYKYLEEFEMGNYRFRGNGDFAEAGIHAQLTEQLERMGEAFGVLKDKLVAEKENTKSLVTDISHQLKTPLASLRMCYELVSGDQLTAKEHQEFLEQEGREIEKLETLLKELVNLSRLEAHMIQLKPVPASLKQTLSGAVSQVYTKARNKDIEIQADIDRDFMICHDAKWTEEAFVNILDNAVKYSGEHTTVTVRAKPLIRNVMIEIEDEGIGIRRNELTKIYQRFYRGEDAAKLAKDGAGVGLYLARMILERQGGTISAKQKPERGTVFRVTLPC